jgi:hypothetical protein
MRTRRPAPFTRLAEGLSYAAAGKVVRAIPVLVGPGQELVIGDRTSRRDLWSA